MRDVRQIAVRLKPTTLARVDEAAANLSLSRNEIIERTLAGSPLQFNVPARINGPSEKKEKLERARRALREVEERQRAENG